MERTPVETPAPPRRRAWTRWAWSWSPQSAREAGDAVVRNFLLHWFPAKINRQSLSVRYSLWLGTITTALFAYLIATGVVLMFLYVPSVERAYQSVKDIEFAVSFGRFFRASHRIAAHLMVVFCCLHLVRVFLTGAYKNGGLARQRRPLNWGIGLALLIGTLLLSFTGYLLPWDQLAYWAITVGTNIARAVPLVGNQLRFVLLGGNEIHQNTLIRFYVLHCVFLPLGLSALFVWHMWRVRKDGLACGDQLVYRQAVAAAPPVSSKTYSLLGITAGRTAAVDAAVVDLDQHQVFAIPALLRRIAIVCLLTLAVVSVLAVGIGSPLEAPADPLVTPNPAKAPWYFLWLQELVTISTVRLGGVTINGALIGGVLVPGLLLVWALLVPWLDRSPPEAAGRWFHPQRRGIVALFLVICLAVLILTCVGTFLRGPYWNFYWPWETWPQEPPQL